MPASTSDSSIPVGLPTTSDSQSGSTTLTSSSIAATSDVIATTTSASSSTITASSSTSTLFVTPTSTSTTSIITSTSSSSSQLAVVSAAALSTDSSGGVVTITRVVPVVASSASPTSNAAASSAKGSGFMQNTGAVAGVFSLVGLLGLAILFVAFMTCVRRRRALKWDRELAAAAANTPRPHEYADFSVERDHDMHSTMGYKHSGYGDMQEIGMSMGARAGAAGVGVQRTRSMGVSSSSWEGEFGRAGAMPYPAFAAPPEAGYHSQYASYHSAYRDEANNYQHQGYDYGYSSSPSPPGHPYNPRRGSVSPDMTLVVDSPPSVSPRYSRASPPLPDSGYIVDSTPPVSPGYPRPSPPQPESYASHYDTPGRSAASTSHNLPNPFGQGHESDYESADDDDDEVTGRRDKVLKVANE